MTNASKPHIVVFSIAYLPMIGGAEVALKELMARLNGYEFSVIVAAHTFAIPAYECIDGVHVYRVGRHMAWLGRVRNYLYIPLAILCALRLHKKQKFSLVWSMMAAYAGGASYWFSRITGVPVVLSLQEGDPLSRIEMLTRWVSRFYRDFFSRVAAVMAISTYLAEIADHFGATAPVSVIPNGADFTRFSTPVSVAKKKQLREAWITRADAIVVFPASRLEVKNGIDIIIQALPVDDRLVLVLAGEGSQETALRELAQTCGVSDRVVFLGSVPNADLPAYYQAADVFARPSRSEGMGVSFIEAMAAGIPMVGTDVGGIKEFAQDGVNMVVVPQEDPQALGQALVRVYDDDALRSTLIAGGQETARRYDWEGIAKKVDTVFENVLDSVQHG